MLIHCCPPTVHSLYLEGISSLSPGLQLCKRSGPQLSQHSGTAPAGSPTVLNTIASVCPAHHRMRMPCTRTSLPHAARRPHVKPLLPVLPVVRGPVPPLPRCARPLLPHRASMSCWRVTPSRRLQNRRLQRRPVREAPPDPPPRAVRVLSVVASRLRRPRSAAGVSGLAPRRGRPAGALGICGLRLLGGGSGVRGPAVLHQPVVGLHAQRHASEAAQLVPEVAGALLQEGAQGCDRVLVPPLSSRASALQTCACTTVYMPFPMLLRACMVFVTLLVHKQTIAITVPARQHLAAGGVGAGAAAARPGGRSHGEADAAHEPHDVRAHDGGVLALVQQLSASLTREACAP